MKSSLIITLTVLTLTIAASVGGLLINELPVVVEDGLYLPPRTEIIDTTHPESNLYKITNLKCAHTWSAQDVIHYIARKMDAIGWETVKENEKIYRLSRDDDQIRIVLHQHRFKTTFTVNARLK